MQHTSFGDSDGVISSVRHGSKQQGSQIRKTYQCNGVFSQGGGEPLPVGLVEALGELLLEAEDPRAALGHTGSLPFVLALMGSKTCIT